MREEFFWALFGGGFIVFWAILISWAQHLRATRRLRERELLHKERVLALEQGISLPDDRGPDTFVAPALQSLALALGFLLLFLGIGLSLAFYLTSDVDDSSQWAMGVIPAMAGIGLLLYSWVSLRFPPVG